MFFSFYIYIYHAACDFIFLIIMNSASTRSALSHTTQNLLSSFNKRLQDDLNAMYENFNEIVKSAKIEENALLDRPTQNYFDIYQMRVRAANIVRAGESLLRLISELKTFIILNDFPSINHDVRDHKTMLNQGNKQYTEHLVKLKDEFTSALHDLESERSIGKNKPNSNG